MVTNGPSMAVTSTAVLPFRHLPDPLRLTGCGFEVHARRPGPAAVLPVVNVEVGMVDEPYPIG